MLIIPINMTSREAYAQYGALTDERMEALFDAEELAENNTNDYHIQEAIAQYPDEDFLEGTINNLQTICKKLKGNNKDFLTAAILRLEQIQFTQERATEYGLEELGKITC